MKVIDLTQTESNSFKITQFPDGQQDVWINPELCNFYQDEFEAQIRSRFNSFKDLELIACAAAALRELGYKHLHLVLPYFFRSSI